METLDSSEVRHLIIKAKLTGGQISDIARTVVDMAVRNGSLHEGCTRHGHFDCFRGTRNEKTADAGWRILSGPGFAPGEPRRSGSGCRHEREGRLATFPAVCGRSRRAGNCAQSEARLCWT
jgi:hypothetical protein